MEADSKCENEEKTQPCDLTVMNITREFEPLINSLPFEIFNRYQIQLLEKPTSFIVPAVWGVDKDKPLTEIQKDIHKAISPAVEDAISSFGTDTLAQEQVFAVRYLLCGMFIFKIISLIEGAKRVVWGDANRGPSHKDIPHWGTA